MVPRVTINTVMKLSRQFITIFALVVAWIFVLQLIGFVATHWQSNPTQNPWKSYNLSNVPYFARWDSGWYASIARQGYTGPTASSAMAFFPLFPILIFLIHSLTSINFFWSGQIIAIAATVISCWLLYLLARHDYSETLARRSIWYFLAFPTSFFLIAVYTESLFLMLLLGSFLCARRQNWIGSVALAMLATAARPIGVFLFPALIIEYLHQKNFKWHAVRPDLLLLFIIPLPFVAFLIFSQVTLGSFWAPLMAQHNFARQLTIIPWYLISYVHDALQWQKIISEKHFYIWYDLASLSIFGAAIVWGWIRQKIRISYLIFSTLALVLPLLSGTLTSISRYVLVIFPTFYLFAEIRNRYFKIFYFLLGLPLLIVASFAFVRWWWVA